MAKRVRISSDFCPSGDPFVKMLCRPPTKYDDDKAACHCPPGLEPLAALDELVVELTIQLQHIFTGVYRGHPLTIRNKMGKRIYVVDECSDTSLRKASKKRKAFDMIICDNNCREVMHIHRPSMFSTCFGPCKRQSLRVYAPRDEYIGKIKQERTLCNTRFVVKNCAGDIVLRIEGPHSLQRCSYGACDFVITSPDGRVQVGRIGKTLRCTTGDIMTTGLVDRFGITFPMDLDVRIKGVLVGACVLIGLVAFR